MRTANRILVSAMALAAATLHTAVAAAQAGSGGSADTPGTAAVPATRGTVAGSPDAGGVEIVVTGSRIARPDLTAASPVAVISQDALKASNAVTVEQLLAVNPQFNASQGTASNNPGDGVSTADLRGLESKRTLVLIDGKRAPFYDTQGSVDLNSIPVALIKRVDVLTGGASAVYGSDAIAGVVNFILDDRFVGLRADGSSQVTSRGDGRQQDASLTAGFKLGDRGNVVAYGGWSKRQGVQYADRPRNARVLDSKDLVTDAGSSNTNPTVFDLANGDQVQVRPDGSLSPDLQLYNYTPVNYAQLPFEKQNALVLLRYDLTDKIEAFGRASYARTKVTITTAPTATAGYTFNVDPSNPFLTAAERATFFGPNAVINDGSGVGDDPTARAGTSQIGIRRRITETPGRIEKRDTKVYQFVGGLRGSFGEGYKWEVFAQYANNKRTHQLNNDLSYSRVAQALDVVAGPGGAPQCFDPSNGCVPLNIFNVRTLTPAELAFVLANGAETTKTTQFVVGGNLAGDIGFLRTPWASHPAAFAIGAEYRREKGSTRVDAAYGSGDLIYYGQGQNIAGKFDVKEIYAELKMPLVDDRPFARSLGLEGGLRYSHYSTAGTVWSFKGGGDWSPVEGLRFRGIFQRAVRAPNLYELYSPVVGATGSLNIDPCAGANVSAQVAAVCVAQGAPARSIGNIPAPISGQINIFSGGNPNLKAEKSDTFTAGFVVNPARLRNFSLSLDYYSIRINNAITQVSPQSVISACFNNPDPTSAACTSIRRNTLNGSLSGNLQFGVPSVNGNISVLSTSGIDVAAGYRHGPRDGFHYATSFAGTYVRSYKKDGIQCAGRFGSACSPIEPIAKWKHLADVTLAYGPVSLLTRWRFLGVVKQDESRLTVDPDTGETGLIKRNRIPAFSYFDQTAAWDVNDKFEFRLGVQNLFDKKSPIVGDTVGNDANAGGTFPNTYDVLGRTFFAGVSAQF